MSMGSANNIKLIFIDKKKSYMMSKFYTTIQL